MFKKNKQDHFVYEGYEPVKSTYSGYIKRRLKSINFYYVAIPAVSLVFAVSAVILVVGGLVNPKQASRINEAAWQVNRENNGISGWTTTVVNSPSILPYIDNNDGGSMSLGFKTGQTYYQGAALCKTYVVPVSHAASEISAIIDTTETETSNTTKWYLRFNGIAFNPQRTELPAPADIATGPLRRFRISTATPTIIHANETLEVCIESTNAGGYVNGRPVYKFKNDRLIRIAGYRIGGAYYETVPDAPVVAATPTPTTTTTSPAVATAATTISKNAWGAWGFPTPTNPPSNHTIPHGSNGSLTISYPKLSTGTYTGGITACWVYTVPADHTVSRIKATIESNDAGANVIVVRATGNPDYALPRYDLKQPDISLTAPVTAGGSISFCNQVVKTANFDTDKLMKVTAYELLGSGGVVTDKTGPLVSVVSPASNATTAGIITLSAKASDPSGIAFVQFKLDNAQDLGTPVTAESGSLFTTTYDSTKLTNDVHTLYAIARDKAGNFTEAGRFTFLVKNASSPTTSTPTTTQPTTTAPSTTTPAACTTAISRPDNVVERIQSESSATRSPFGKSTGSQLVGELKEADGCKSAKLTENDRYVKVTVDSDKVPSKGRYAVIIRGRSGVQKDKNYGDGLARAKVVITYSPRTVEGVGEQTINDMTFTPDFASQVAGTIYELKEGTKVTISATFTNAYHSTNGSRSLWLDYFELRHSQNTSSIGTAATASPAVTGGATTPKTPVVPAKPSCDALAASNTESEAGKIEGEQMQRSALACAGFDPKATGVTGSQTPNAGVLFTNRDSLSHSFSVPGGSDSEYAVDALVRSDVLTLGAGANQPAEMEMTIASKALGLSEKVTAKAGNTANPTNYALVSFLVQDPAKKNLKLLLKSGTVLQVTLKLLNDDHYTCSNTPQTNLCRNSDRNVWIDYVQLRPLASPIAQPTNINRTTKLDTIVSVKNTIEAESPDSSADVTCGGLKQLPTSCNTNKTSDGKSIQLSFKGSNLTYSFHNLIAGKGKAGFTLKSHDWQGSAKADIWLDDQKKTVTVSSDAYKFYGFSDVQFNAGSVHQLKVSFVNDKCGNQIMWFRWSCNERADRNLLIDQIQVTLPSKSVNDSPSRSL